MKDIVNYIVLASLVSCGLVIAYALYRLAITPLDDDGGEDAYEDEP